MVGGGAFTCWFCCCDTCVFVWQEIQYSHLILCTGTDGPFPGKCHSESSLEASVQKYEDLLGQVSPPVLLCQSSPV